MAEVLPPSIEVLKVTEDLETLDRQVFLDERALCMDLLRKGSGVYEADLKFPVVIGEVPEDERTIFSSLKSSDLSLSELAVKLPGTASIIGRDFELLGILPDPHITGRGSGATAEIILKDVFPHTVTSWHMDGIDAGSAPIPDMFYLISDIFPTSVYEGPAKMRVYEIGHDDNTGLKIEPDELDPMVRTPRDFNGRGRLAVAPRYGIMRMNAMSIHCATALSENDISQLLSNETSYTEEDLMRTLMRVWLNPKVEPHATPLG